MNTGTDAQLLSEIEVTLDDLERRLATARTARSYEEVVAPFIEMTTTVGDLVTLLTDVVGRAQAATSLDTTLQDVEASEVTAARTTAALERTTRILGGMAAISTDRGVDMRTITRRIGAARLLRVV